MDANRVRDDFRLVTSAATCALVAALSFALFGCASSPPKHTHAGAFTTGQYRNLFAEAGHAPQEVSAKINATFQQLFHGDPDTQSVYFPA